jgi:hypothetical protein
MIRIINGKRYNTETATQIADWDNGLPTSDFGWCEETLYRTEKGNFFLVGEGGGMSKYAESVEGGKARSSGKDLIPLTPEQARAWLEQHDEIESIEEYFSDEIEDA